MLIIPNLPASITREVFATLCALLPPPVSDTREARAAREETAMASVVALSPADAFEAELATQIVGARAHAKDCLRLAVQPGQQPEDVRRNRAQAGMMMRHAQSGLRALERRQAVREKAATETRAAALARGEIPAAGTAPLPEAAEIPQPGDLTEAERYAVIYPDRAARIRAHGGLPARFDLGPPDPAALVEALVNGTSPILRALDHSPPAVAAAA